jgi:hypothetical protein
MLPPFIDTFPFTVKFPDKVSLAGFVHTSDELWETVSACATASEPISTVWPFEIMTLSVIAGMPDGDQRDASFHTPELRDVFVTAIACNPGSRHVRKRKSLIFFIVTVS